MTMPKKYMCLFGAGGHAKVIIDILERTERYCIYGLFDDNQDLWGQSILGVPIIGGKAEIQQIQAPFIISIGHNHIRYRLASEFRKQNISFVTAVHQGAVISRNVHIGNGTVIMAGVVVNADTVIHEHVIVNTCASIDHDCSIGAASHIAPGAHLCGGITVGECTLVGAGATITPNINIGRDVVIGAGATVVNDVPDRVMVLGTPAKIVQTLS